MFTQRSGQGRHIHQLTPAGGSGHHTCSGQGEGSHPSGGRGSFPLLRGPGKECEAVTLTERSIPGERRIVGALIAPPPVRTVCSGLSRPAALTRAQPPRPRASTTFQPHIHSNTGGVVLSRRSPQKKSTPSSGLRGGAVVLPPAVPTSARRVLGAGSSSMRRRRHLGSGRAPVPGVGNPLRSQAGYTRRS